MRALLPFLAIAATPAPVSVLVADTEARWVPFDLTPGNQIRFLMTVNGRPATAILDTGVSTSVLSRRFAAASGLTVGAGGRAATIGGTVDVGTVSTSSLAVGGLVRTGGTLAVVDLPATATGSAEAVDLLVGRDLTAPFALDIDYRQRRFRFLKSGRMPFPGLTAPLAISPDRQVYVSAVALGGQPLRPVVVDTGDGSALTLSAPAWAQAKVAATAVTSTISYGIAGPVTSDLAIVPALTIGQASARDVEVRIEPAGGFSETIGVAGRIGSGLLQRYRVLLDPSAGHMLLAAEPGAQGGPVRSTSGLLLGIARDRLRVLHVMRGGPAAGVWHEGETICAVDGTPVGAAYLSSPAARWVTGTPGTVVTLRLCDGQERRLTLRRFY